ACVLVFWLVFDVTAPIVGPWLAYAVEMVFYAVFFPIAWLIEQVLRLLIRDGADLPTFAPEAPIAPPDADTPGRERSGWELGGLYAMRTLGLLLVLGIVAL